MTRQQSKGATMKRIINIDGQAVEYEMRGPYKNLPGTEAFCFYAGGSIKDEVVVVVQQLKGETHDDTVRRAFSCVSIE